MYELKKWQIELLHASDPRSEMVEINKVVYEIDICKVVKIACDGNLQNMYDIKPWNTRSELVEINKVVYEIDIGKVVKIACDWNL